MRVSFTGHRPQGLPFFGEDDPMCIELKEHLSNKIGELIGEGALEFYTGMALGVDTWAAEAVLELRESDPRLKLIAVLPCPEQPQLWQESDKQRYEAILSRCDKVMIISPRYYKGCMHKRDRALVELCDVLLAVFNGKSGGTKFTVDYARKKGRRVEIVKPII